MEQIAHTWIAIRAIALLADEGQTSTLVDLLKPHARESSVGAWIPDRTDARRAGARAMPDNHVLKLAPFKGREQAKRFTMVKKDLLSNLGEGRQMRTYLKGNDSLDEKWWARPYKADPSPGQHLANRAMAMGTTISDVLAFGDDGVEKLLPGEPQLRPYMHPDCLTEEAAAAMYFFMLSHFVADACMPCHCDNRVLTSYAKGKVHEAWEKHWAKAIGDPFEEDTILPPSMRRTWTGTDQGVDGVLQQARDVDNTFDIDFGSNAVPAMTEKKDLWLDTVYVCRASFALSCIAFPPDTYGYTGKATPSFKDSLAQGDPDLLVELDRAVMHDAVLNTAIAWKHLWTGFKPSAKEGKKPDA